MQEKLNAQEESWLTEFDAINKQKPNSLKLILDRESDGNIVIATQPYKRFTKTHLTWISRLQNCLNQIPDTPGFWLLSNIDGWSVGKGSPSFFSGTTVGEGGATGSLRENFCEFYHCSMDIEYGEFSEEFYSACEYKFINSSLGELKIKNISSH